MAWTTSQAFREWMLQTMQVSGTGYTGLDSDTVRAALFNNTVTPDASAAVSSAGYGVGTWTTAREVTGGTNWPAKGLALTGKTFTSPDTGVAMFDAADLPAGGTLTLSNAYGCLVYDDSITGGTVADQGICFLYFGGAQSVTAGNFSIIWNSGGILRFQA
jgi:hypothetical protein